MNRPWGIFSSHDQVAGAERRARRSRAQIVAAEERADAAERECAQRRAAEAEWHMQRAEWREARREDRARVQRANEVLASVWAKRVLSIA
jgi:hypothetical protein